MPGAREFFEGLNRGRTLVRIDLRGVGMSDRAIDDYSTEARADDVEAVLNDLGIEQFDLLVGRCGVSPALVLASCRRAGLQRCILLSPSACPPGESFDPGMMRLMEADWDQFLELSLQANTRRPLSQIQDVLSFVRRCMDRRSYGGISDAFKPWDDWERATKIGTPVLVIDEGGRLRMPAGRLRAFAERFPNGHFVSLPEGTAVPPYGDPELILQALGEFLGPPPASPVEASAPLRQLSTRESEVLRLLAAGHTQPEIATALTISPSTVSHHVESVYSKIGVHRRAEAATWAVRNGFG
ncbi:MAG: alpha/beta fold hydrolase [Tepidiformaceae bacterium]